MTNTLFNSGQTMILLSGANYLLLTGEVGINGVVYNMTDVEITLTDGDPKSTARNTAYFSAGSVLSDALTNKVRIGIKKVSGIEEMPAQYSKFDDWIIDNVRQTTLNICIANIRSAEGSGARLLYGVYAGIIKGNYTSTTSGLLVIGKTYNVIATLSTDDFSNVGWVTDGVDFVATGTTPTIWTNSSEVVNVTDSAPTIVELENSTGETVTPSYNATTFKDTITISGSAFAVDKVGIVSFAIGGTAVAFDIVDTSTVTAGTGASVDHYFEIRIYP